MTGRAQRDGARSLRPPERYRSIAKFYAADLRRLRSRELDMGLWWREDVSDALHRAAWVCDTGELYLVRLGPAEEGGGEVQLLASVKDRRRLESALMGWRGHCGQPRSLTWLRQRAAGLADRRAPDVARQPQPVLLG
jgi:hypothetical protein